MLFAQVCYSVAIVRYVDPDAVGGGTGLDWTNAYTSQNACEAAEQQDLTDGGGDTWTVYCRSSAGTDDTTAVNIWGWTTGATNYIQVIGYDFPTNGVFDGTKYVLHNNDTDTWMFIISEDYVRIVNLQVLVTQSTAAARHAISLATATAEANDRRIDSCIIKSTGSGATATIGVISEAANGLDRIFNTHIYGFISGAATGACGISIVVDSTVKIYNCTIDGCYRGIRQGPVHTSDTITAINNAIFNNTDDFSAGGTGTFTIDYCASDDGDGTNAQDFTAEATDWNAVFTDYANGDVSLKNYSTPPCCVGVGTDDPGAGLYSDDIIATARSSVWDIGAFEYVAAAAPGGQVITVEMR